jgi:flagellar FliJ protein
MARAFRLQVLLDLAQRRLETATRELQRLRTAWSEAQSKLDQLRAYEAEYAAALDTRLVAGMSTHQFNDYCLFLGKLARAIQAQAEEVDRRRRAWEEEHARWLSLRQRQQALGVRAQRHDATELAIEVRREQKEQDEFALKAVKDNPVVG